MSEQDWKRMSFEKRSRTLFQDSVDGLDFALRSRLTQARNAAIEAAAARRRPVVPARKCWTPAAGVTAAAILGASCGWVRHWRSTPLQ